MNDVSLFSRLMREVIIKETNKQATYLLQKYSTTYISIYMI
jgi:hypothetical protein